VQDGRASITKARVVTALPPAAERPLVLAVRHINASVPDPIDAETLLAALTVRDGACAAHLYAFFDEVEIETISDLARSGAVSYAVLAEGARGCLPPDHATRIWLDERA
jgi:hypothetical protein